MVVINVVLLYKSDEHCSYYVIFNSSLYFLLITILCLVDYKIIFCTFPPDDFPSFSLSLDDLPRYLLS